VTPVTPLWATVQDVVHIGASPLLETRRVRTVRDETSPKTTKDLTVNTTQLVGRLTADPVLRHTSNGTPVTDVRLAVDRRGDGTDFISVTVWSRTAEVVTEHLERGRRVGVTGRLEQQQWTDKASGTNRERLVVVADSIEFLDAPRRTTDQTDQPESADSPAPAPV